MSIKKINPPSSRDFGRRFQRDRRGRAGFEMERVPALGGQARLGVRRQERASHRLAPTREC